MFQRFANWLRGRSRAKASTAAGAGTSAGSHSAMGQWATDHYAESQHYRGWNYVAIRTLGMQAAEAHVAVYQDGPNRDVYRSIRKSLRQTKRAPSWATKSMVSHASTPLPDDSPLMQLLRRPNPSQSGAIQRFEMVVQLQLTGSAIVWKVRNQFGLTVHRYVIPTAACSPVPPAEGCPTGGVLVRNFESGFMGLGLAFTTSSGYAMAANRVIPWEDLLIVRLPHPLRSTDGYSPTSAGAAWIDQAYAIDRSRTSQLHRGPNPSMLVEPPADVEVSQEQLDAIADKLNDKYGGPENVGKIMCVGHGKATRLTNTPEEMAYFQSFDQMASAVLAVHGVTKATAGLQDSMTYGSLAASFRGLSRLTIQPLLSLIDEQETFCQSPEFGSGLTVEYEATEIDDPDLELREDAVMITSKAVRKGEWRERKGLPRFGDSRDEELLGEPSTAVPGTPAVRSEAEQMVTAAAADLSPDTVDQIADAMVPQSVASAAPANQLDFETRREWQRKQAAIQDVVSQVADGSLNPRQGVVFLTLLGLGKDQAMEMLDGIGSTPSVASPPPAAKSIVAVRDDQVAESVSESDGFGAPRESVLKALRELRTSGHRIAFQTLHPDSTVVRAWLDKHRVPADFVNATDVHADYVFGESVNGRHHS